MDDPRPAIVRSIARRTVAGEAWHGVKSRPVPLDAKLAVEDAFRLTLLGCLAQVSANAGAMRSGHEAESLHQLRVGLRRLQVALAGFGEATHAAMLKELRDRAKAIASRLGPARDLDVFTAELLPGPARAAGGRAAFAVLKSRAEAAREAAWDAAADCIVRADFGRFLDDVALAAEQRQPRADGKPLRLRRAAGRVLDDNLARVRKRGRKAKSRAERDFHHLRIALKKLRYASEFFAPLYKQRSVVRYMKRLKRLQDGLGGLNDIAHLHVTLAQLLAHDGQEKGDDLRFAAGQIDGWHRARGAALTRDVLHRWDRFKRLDPFWR